jgi:hypothetical protein
VVFNCETADIMKQYSCIKFCVKTGKIIVQTCKILTKSAFGQEALSPAEHLTGFLGGKGKAMSARDNPHLTIIIAHWGHNSSCSWKTCNDR